MEKTEMYLRRRNNGVWYFRRPVPPDLTDVFHPSRFTRSLGTCNKSEAFEPFAAALAQSERDICAAREKIRAAREQGRDGIYPTWAARKRIKAEKAKRKRSRVFCQYGEREMLLLLSRWFEQRKRKTETIYRDAFTLSDKEGRDAVLKELDEDQKELMGNPPELADLVISREVRTILEGEDCEPPLESLSDPLFRRFYGLVTEGLLYLNQMAVSLVKTGEMPERFQTLPAFAPASQPMLNEPFGGALGGTNATRSVTLNELIERFQNEPRRKDLREASREEYHFTYRLLREHFGGDRPIASITRDDIRAVAKTIRHLPARATLVDKTTPLQELAERAEAKGQSPINVKTYNKKARHVSVIFRYAVIEQLISSNPAQNLGEKEPPSNGEEKAFNVEQLKAIFTGSIYKDFTEGGKALQFVPNHHWQPCLFWAPLIALFHGMRSNEILQLKVENIFKKDGVWVMKIEGELKNFQSYRTLPLHPEVLRIGLVEYAEQVKKAGYSDLFPDAKTAVDGKRSTWFQKPFSRYLKKIGIKTDRRQCFHSFRHTWNTGMRRADVPDEIRKVLGGWSNGSAESGYGSQDMARLLKYLEKLEYPSLDLRPLYITTNF